MIVRGHYGDWSVNACVVDEWTRRSSWQHLLAVVWYCVRELPLQRLSRVTASVINVTMRAGRCRNQLAVLTVALWANPGIS